MNAPVRRIGLGALLRDPSSEAVEQVFGIQSDPWDTARKFFTFPRRKIRGQWGFEVWLWRDGACPHGVNLTAREIAPFPRLRADAEEWAGRLGDEYGFKAMRRVRQKPRRPRAKLSLIPGGAP